MDMQSHLAKIFQNNSIEEKLYSLYDVKRGLRNANGTGVVVGLTRVGDVHGYIMDEGERVPVDGKLYYRGIDVEMLVKYAQQENRYGYEEAVYLLMFGDLPVKRELDAFTAYLGEKRALPNNFAEDSIMKAPSSNIMNKLARSVLACYAYDSNPEDTSPENVLRQCLELVARFPTIVAYSYMAKKHYYDRESLFIHTPAANGSTAETLLSLITTGPEIHSPRGGSIGSCACHPRRAWWRQQLYFYRSRRHLHGHGYLFGHCRRCRFPKREQTWRCQYQSHGHDGKY